jgi:hypothetical protein
LGCAKPTNGSREKNATIIRTVKASYASGMGKIENIVQTALLNSAGREINLHRHSGINKRHKKF